MYVTCRRKKTKNTLDMSSDAAESVKLNGNKESVL